MRALALLDGLMRGLSGLQGYDGQLSARCLGIVWLIRSVKHWSLGGLTSDQAVWRA